MSNEIPQELLRRIAHAIRSPLGLIRGTVSEIQSGTQNEDARRLLDFAIRGSAQLERMAERLGTLARLCDPERSKEMSRSELSELVAAAVADVREVRSRKRIEIVVEAMPRVVGVVEASTVRLAISELVDNGVRLARERVEVSLDLVGSSARVSVRDDGRARTTTLASGAIVHPQADGTGLGIGLAIAERVAALHGGTIRLAHRPELGAEGMMEAELELPGCEAKNG